MPSEEQLHRERLDQVRNQDGNAFAETGQALVTVTSGPKWKAPLEAIKLAFKLRREAEDHQNAPWLIALTFAIICDALDYIPAIGWLITLFFRPFLFFFLWGRGTWKIRLIRFIMILLDFIPVVNLVPWSTISVIYAYTKSKDRADQAESQLHALKAG